MRQRKYRAYDNVLKKMFKWDQIKTYHLEALTIKGTLEFTEWTGFKDKNDREIYEGDIIFAYDKNWKVIFQEGCFIAWGAGRMRALRLMQGHNAAYCEVIGNVFENPKVLATR